MPSKTRKRLYKIKNKKNWNKKYSLKKKRREKKKGGSKEECCMCRNKINGTSFIPSGCLMKNGKIRAHKICSDCWWNSFAKEGVNHQCPGCAKGLPLHGSPPPKIVDLTEDD